MQRRALFLDYDGTLAEHGVVPAVHVELLHRLRERGHAVVLSTGRSASIVAEDVLALMDGAICSAGAHVRLGDRVLRDERYPEPLARRAVDVLTGIGAPFVLEAPEALYGPSPMVDWLRDRAAEQHPPAPGTVGGGARDLADAAVVPEDLAACSFAKISLWRSPVSVDEIAARIGPEVAALPNSISREEGASGELPLRRIDKADGLRLVAEALGLPITATIGVGDGMNDLGMLRAAGTAVAIHGAPAVVREAADLEVAGPLRGGLQEAAELLDLL